MQIVWSEDGRGFRNTTNSEDGNAIEGTSFTSSRVIENASGGTNRTNNNSEVRQGENAATIANQQSGVSVASHFMHASTDENIILENEDAEIVALFNFQKLVLDNESPPRDPSDTVVRAGTSGAQASESTIWAKASKTSPCIPVGITWPEVHELNSWAEVREAISRVIGSEDTSHAQDREAASHKHVRKATSSTQMMPKEEWASLTRKEKKHWFQKRAQLARKEKKRERRGQALPGIPLAQRIRGITFVPGKQRYLNPPNFQPFYTQEFLDIAWKSEGEAEERYRPVPVRRISFDNFPGPPKRI